MFTNVKPELSVKNKYRIDKHRYYELRYFCLQYPEWKRKYNELSDISISSLSQINYDRYGYSDPTGIKAITKACYANRINIVELAARESDEELGCYILKGVTEGLSYTQLKTRFDIPCSKDTYYDRYRRFFWLLSKYKE